MSSRSSISSCRPSTSLCVADPNFTFDNITSSSVSITSHSHVVIDMDAFQGARLLDDGVHPITLRAGDINLGESLCHHFLLSISNAY
jgi:hypothetical protein